MAQVTTRSTKKRNGNSSPPKAAARKSAVSVRRPSTRSQSRDLAVSNSDSVQKRKRNVQVREDNVAAKPIIASSRRNTVRRAPATIDLPIVTEEQDVQELDDLAHHEEKGINQDDQTSQYTTNSSSQIALLDPTAILVSLLPLYHYSLEILNLLAPPKLSQNVIQNLIQDLKMPRSEVSKRLSKLERAWDIVREDFGTVSQPIISSNIILKLLKTTQPLDELCRPDAVAHAANIASLLKELLVHDRESHRTAYILMQLDLRFPEPYVGNFSPDLRFGNSELKQETFNLGLHIRIQHLLIVLRDINNQTKCEPKHIEMALVSTFFEQPPLPFDEAMVDGILKPILTGSPNSKEQSVQIKRTIYLICQNFRDNGNGIDDRDLINFKNLHEIFPWLRFQEDLACWSRHRAEELTQSIHRQGGIENIRSKLSRGTEDTHTQGEVTHPESPTGMQPELAKFVDSDSASRKDSDSKFFNRDSVHALISMKVYTSSGPSAKTTLNSSPSPSIFLASGEDQSSLSCAATNSEYNLQLIGLHNCEAFTSQSANEIVDNVIISIENYSNDRIKENKPRQFIEKKPSIMNRQPHAQRVTWNSQESEAVPAHLERLHYERDDSEESFDTSFQQDKRILAPVKRAREPSVNRYSPIENEPSLSKPAEAVRCEESEDLGWVGSPAHKNNGSDNNSKSPTPRLEQEDEEEDEDVAEVETNDEDEDEAGDALLPSHTKTALRKVTAESRLAAARPRLKIPWTEHDEKQLIRAIEHHGCRWSMLLDQLSAEGMDHKRDQVALKDKARNIKVNLLKLRMPLPRHFDEVRLGSKEITAVRKVVPNYEP